VDRHDPNGVFPLLGHHRLALVFALQRQGRDELQERRERQRPPGFEGAGGLQDLHEVADPLRPAGAEGVHLDDRDRPVDLREELGQRHPKRRIVQTPQHAERLGHRPLPFFGKVGERAGPGGLVKGKVVDAEGGAPQGADKRPPVGGPKHGPEDIGNVVDLLPLEVAPSSYDKIGDAPLLEGLFVDGRRPRKGAKQDGDVPVFDIPVVWGAAGPDAGIPHDPTLHLFLDQVDYPSCNKLRLGPPDLFGGRFSTGIGIDNRDGRRAVRLGGVGNVGKKGVVLDGVPLVFMADVVLEEGVLEHDEVPLAPVVGLQPVDRAAGFLDLFHYREKYPDIGIAKPIDRLLRGTDDTQLSRPEPDVIRPVGDRAVFRQEKDDVPEDRVDVLKLVHEDIVEFVLVAPPDKAVPFEEKLCLPDQVEERDDPAPPFLGPEEVDEVREHPDRGQNDGVLLDAGEEGPRVLESVDRTPGPVDELFYCLELFSVTPFLG